MTYEPLAVTGIGCVSPYGLGTGRLWAGLTEGRSALGPAPWSTPSRPASIARAPIERTSEPRTLQLARAAIRDGLNAAPSLSFSGVGLIVSSNGEFGAPDNGDETSRLAAEFGVLGPVLGLRSDCASGIAGLLVAEAWLRSGRCDHVILVGASSLLEERVWRGLSASGALGSAGGAEAKPFSSTRSGTAAAEGSAAVLLARGPAKAALAHVVGASLSINPAHLVALPTDGIVMTEALVACTHARGTGDLRGVIAHGTGTPTNDLAEYNALRKLLQDRLPDIPLTSIKRYLGHTFAAAALFNIIAGVLSLRDKRLPGCGTTDADPAMRGARINSRCSPFAAGGSILVLAHGMGVINGAAMVAETI